MNHDDKICCSATLIVTGTDLDPDAVSELLGLAPTQTWRKGEYKRFERPDGTVRQFGSIHEWGGWKCSLWIDHQDAPLCEQINSAVDTLASRATALAELRADGNDVELNCSDSSSGSSHLPLSRHLLKQLVDLSVDLDVTVYR